MRFTRALWDDVREGLRVRAGRSALAAGAIALGAAALTILLGTVSGLQERATQLTRVLGSQTLAVFGPPAADAHAMRLQSGFAAMLSANLPGVQASAIRRDFAGVPGHDGRLEVIATDASLADVRSWPMAAGRFLDAADLTHAERNLVLTRALSQAWGWHVGDVVQLERSPFTVVGVVDTPVAGLDANVLAPDIVVHDQTVFVPDSVIPQWIRNQSYRPAGADALFLRLPPDGDFVATQAEAANLLGQSRVDVSRLAWVTPASLTAGLNKFRDMVEAVAGGIMLLSMLLGGITLTSLMVANVQDRVAEIGLRRSFGALPSDVAVLFVSEAMLLTLAASGAGTLLGIVLVRKGPALPLPVELNALALLGPLGMGVALGALSAWWPARLAARIEPAQALRQS